ncbi:hypothetical protein J6590_094005, partial [Homalodisca vitripennis]
LGYVPLSEACGEIQWCCLVGPIHSWCKQSCVHAHCGYIIHWSDRCVARVRSTVRSLWGDTVVLSGGSNSQVMQAVMCACTLRLHNTWSDRYVARLSSTVRSLCGDTVVLSGGSNSQMVQAVMCA